MNDDARRQRDDAMRAHDVLMAEAAEAEGRRNTARVLLARKSGRGGVFHTATVDNASVAAPEPDAMPSNGGDGWTGWNNWIAHHLGLLRDQVMEAVGMVVVENNADLRQKWKEDIHRHVGMLRDQGRTVHNVYARVDQRMKEFHSEVEFIVQNEYKQYERLGDALRYKLRAENAELHNKLDAVLKRLEQADNTVKALAAELESERKDREALIASFEARFAGLYGLVKGLAGDWNAMS